jgi:hypothetical protein
MYGAALDVREKLTVLFITVTMDTKKARSFWPRNLVVRVAVILVYLEAHRKPIV